MNKILKLLKMLHSGNAIGIDILAWESEQNEKR